MATMIPLDADDEDRLTRLAFTWDCTPQEVLKRCLRDAIGVRTTKVVFVWHNIEDVEPVTVEMGCLPSIGDNVVLTFSKGTPEHPFRVMWVRWYPIADPPHALVHVTQR